MNVFIELNEYSYDLIHRISENLEGRPTNYETADNFLYLPASQMTPKP